MGGEGMIRSDCELGVLRKQRCASRLLLLLGTLSWPHTTYDPDQRGALASVRSQRGSW